MIRRFEGEWIDTSLGDVCELISDGTHQTPAYVSRGVPFYSVENITADDFVNTKFISMEDHELLSARNRLRIDDILMTRIGSLGDTKLIRWNVEASFYVSLALLRSSRQILPLFLYVLTQSDQFVREVESRSLLSAVPKKINMADISLVKIQIPRDLNEQRAIAAALSDTDDLIASLESLIVKKRDIKQAVMQQLLTGRTRLPGFEGEWETARVGSLGSLYGGLAGKSKADFDSGTASYISFLDVVSNVTAGQGECPTVQVGPHEVQNRVSPGDLLFNGSSETADELALCAVVGDVSEETYLNSFCFGLRLEPVRRDSPLFLTHLFRSSIGRDRVKSLAQGSTRYNIAKSRFKKLTVPLPSPEEQEAIAAVLSDMDAEIEALEARLAKTRDIKVGMMQELLTGRTRLPIPEDGDGAAEVSPASTGEGSGDSDAETEPPEIAGARA